MDFLDYVYPAGDRFKSSLESWDPLEDCLFLKWLDPIQNERNEITSGRIHYHRLLIFTLITSAPPFIFSLIPSITFGGRFFGQGGMYQDVFVYFFFLVMLPGLTLALLYGRRILGDMTIKITTNFGAKIDKGYSELPSFLKLLNNITTPDFKRILFWVSIALATNTNDYINKLHWRNSIWMTNPSTPGTLFHFLSVNGSQPNLAGIYGGIISSSFYTIILLLLSRLVVKFSIMCIHMASSLKEKIMPAHPDKTGGLLPVGQAALFFSIPIMMMGISIAIGGFMDAFVWKRSVSQTVYIWWFFYVAFGPLLFFLPLLPLRRLMYKSKHSYLSYLRSLYRNFEANISSIENKSTIEYQLTIGVLIEKAEKMSVWPFDRVTFLRFGGMAASPLIAVFAGKWPELIQQIINHLFH